MRSYRRHVAVCGHFLISAANSLSEGISPLPTSLVELKNSMLASS
jgi:hypothetical protein